MTSNSILSTLTTNEYPASNVSGAMTVHVLGVSTSVVMINDYWMLLLCLMIESCFNCFDKRNCEPCCIRFLSLCTGASADRFSLERPLNIAPFIWGLARVWIVLPSLFYPAKQLLRFLPRGECLDTSTVQGNWTQDQQTKATDPQRHRNRGDYLLVRNCRFLMHVRISWTFCATNRRLLS